jgi:hypothetical protein
VLFPFLGEERRREPVRPHLRRRHLAGARGVIFADAGEKPPSTQVGASRRVVYAVASQASSVSAISACPRSL